MNTRKIAIALAALVAGSAIASTADAHGRRYHQPRSHVGIWFTVPGPVFYPQPYYYPRYYYPPRPYYPPAVLAPAPVAPPVYIERPPIDAAAPADVGYWYYCRESQTYYPYVQQCPSPWERVIPHAAPPS